MTQQHPHRPGSSRARRLRDRFCSALPTRSRYHRILGGVCGGLAQAWGLPALLVRVGVVLLSVLPGPMWAVYALAWTAMPLEDPQGGGRLRR